MVKGRDKANDIVRIRADQAAQAASATEPPLDVERLARALPEWMVEHPRGTTEGELRMQIARVVADEYARLGTEENIG